MAAWNSEEHLKEAIDSILNQTFQDLELIIVNDGSTDGTEKIIKSYSSGKIIYVKNIINTNVSKSRNIALSLAKGKYIAIMDSDDISCHNRLEQQVSFMENNHDIGVCGSWAQEFDSYGSRGKLTNPLSDNGLKVLLLFSVPFINPSVIFRRKLVKDFNISYDENYKYSEDYRFWLDCSEYTKFANIPKFLLKYRYVLKGLTRTAERTNFQNKFNVSKSIHSKVLSKLNLSLSDEEYYLHYRVGLISKIVSDYICLDEMDTYFRKLLLHNLNIAYFDQREMDKLLCRKFTIAAFHNFKNSNITSYKFILRRWVYMFIYYKTFELFFLKKYFINNEK